MAKSSEEKNIKPVETADSEGSAEKRTKSEGVAKKDTGSKESAKSSAVSKSQIIIAVLATILVCVGVFLAIAFGTGMVKFSGQNDGDNSAEVSNPDSTDTPSETPAETKKPSATPISMADSGQTYDNPNPKVKINGRKVSVKGLEFYLPNNFIEATKAGGSDDLAVTYNLTDDDGWADVKIYVKKTGKDARDFLLEKSPKLTFEQDALVMNGWSWSEGCAASCAI